MAIASHEIYGENGEDIVGWQDVDGNLAIGVNAISEERSMAIAAQRYNPKRVPFSQNREFPAQGRTSGSTTSTAFAGIPAPKV